MTRTGDDGGDGDERGGDGGGVSGFFLDLNDGIDCTSTSTELPSSLASFDTSMLSDESTGEWLDGEGCGFGGTRAAAVSVAELEIA